MPCPTTLRRNILWVISAALLAVAGVTSEAVAQTNDRSQPANQNVLPTPPGPPQTRPTPTRKAPQAFEIDGTPPQQPTGKEQRFLIERIDPERTLDVTTGRPSILRFKVPPFRDQVGDPDIVDVLSLTETELSITGKEVGSTVLNLWFKDPGNPNGQEVLSYLIRVSEDPERSRQYDILLENLERDLNRGFPNSVVDLS